MAVLVVAITAITAPDDKNKNDAAQTVAPSSGSASASPSSSAKPSTSASSDEPGPSLSLGGSSSASGSQGGRLPLVVLNNTRTNGLATQAAENFRQDGWTVTDIGNLNNDILSSCAYYDPNVDGAKAAARKLQRDFPGIQRTAEKFAELPKGPIVVVLTSDYSGG